MVSWWEHFFYFISPRQCSSILTYLLYFFWFWIQKFNLIRYLHCSLKLIFIYFFFYFLDIFGTSLGDFTGEKLILNSLVTLLICHFEFHSESWRVTKDWIFRTKILQLWSSSQKASQKKLFDIPIHKI